MKRSTLWGKASDLAQRISKTHSGEEIYHCPYCIEVRGKPDIKGKLYYNPRKGVGKCFLCNTVVYDDKSPDMDSVFLRYYDKEPEKLSRLYTLGSWTLDVKQCQWAGDYLLNRGIYPAVVDKYYIRCCKTPFPGIVFPNNLVGGKTDYFQIRSIDPKSNRPKYTNPSMSPKPLYGTFTVGSTTESAVICEGVVSAISFSYLDNLATLALLGKEIAPIQLSILKSLPIKEYFLCLDGGEVDSIMKRAQQLLGVGINPRIVTLPWKVDPNDIISVGEHSYHQLEWILDRATKPLTNLALTLIKADIHGLESGFERWNRFCESCRRFT